MRENSNAPGLDRAIALPEPEAFNKYQELGKELEPQLLADGSNFSNWEAALKYAVTTELKVKDHFVQTELDQSGDRADLKGIFIEHSIHISLLWSVRGKNGRMAFKVLQARFAPTGVVDFISRGRNTSGQDREEDGQADQRHRSGAGSGTPPTIPGSLSANIKALTALEFPCHFEASARTVSCQYLHLGRMRAIMCCSSLGATRCVTNNVGFP
ncbi:hypothetical protein PGTUg99_005132 [Puccinia graminis f. sp. tritici]|uniref:Uncharacterized protein n=1 Tax=Puccinia graminis f. sp. tritici TaxID=56615 RepID=A0A5B0LVC3_PUCGR|nr:hypothetical protein PGTUg99_005132 [Puccinia graminis f. sp. tritici]